MSDEEADPCPGQGSDTCDGSDAALLWLRVQRPTRGVCLALVTNGSALPAVREVPSGLTYAPIIDSRVAERQEVSCERG